MEAEPTAWNVHTGQVAAAHDNSILGASQARVTDLVCDLSQRRLLVPQRPPRTVPEQGSGQGWDPGRPWIHRSQVEWSRGARAATGDVHAEGARHPPGRLPRGDGPGGRQGAQGPSGLWSSGLDPSVAAASEVQAGMETTAWLVTFFLTFINLAVLGLGCSAGDPSLRCAGSEVGVHRLSPCSMWGLSSPIWDRFYGP